MNFIQNSENRERLLQVENMLRQWGIHWAQDRREYQGMSGRPLEGKTYVLTGSLESMTRSEAKAALEALGAKVTGSVSKATTGVIVGSNPGSKFKIAEKLSIQILSEDDLQQILEGEGRR